MSNNCKSICSLTDNINVVYKPDLLDNHTADKYLYFLEKNLVYNPDEDSKVTVMGKQYYISRKQTAYGEPGTYYRFAGNTVYAHDWNSDIIVCKIIKKIKSRVEVFTGQKYNFVLINRYANGDDKIGAHRDDEKELGDNPTIVGVSLGASRDVCFVPYRFIPEKLEKRISLTLEHGSVYAMYPPTNEYWTHEIPKRANVNKPRISLTFRHLYV
jgi:alpha-ketoglutarate-dependent dioxygenase alkB family protein 2